MTPITVREQLQSVEWLIERLRDAGARTRPNSNEGMAYRALKMIAIDLLGRLPGAPSALAQQLERRVHAVTFSKTAFGYSNGALRGLGEDVMGSWPRIRRALELADAASEPEETRG